MIKYQNIKRDDLIIRIHHVGGIGGYGPTEILSKLDHTQWIVYDAEKEALAKSDKLRSSKFSFVNKCLGKKNTISTFNVMHATSASSMLKSDPAAANYTVLNPGGKGQIWGKHTKVSRSFKLKVWSLDWLVKTKKVPPVDFLSMDTQGAEVDIIDGASKQAQSSIVAVCCETDFSSLYENQPLFCDIQNRLRDDNFRLCQIYNQQFFNTSPFIKDLQGRGFLTVGESLFLKEPKIGDHSYEGVVSSLKLAAISAIFDELDFALKIIRELEKENLVSLKAVYKKTKVKYIKMLSDLNEKATILESQVPEITYESTNAMDANKEPSDTKGFLEINYKKLLFFLKYFASYYTRRSSTLFLKKNANVYFSPISQIYSDNNFGDLAELHDLRVGHYYIFSYPSHLDKYLIFLLRWTNLSRQIKASRNYFKGRFQW